MCYDRKPKIETGRLQFQFSNEHCGIESVEHFSEDKLKRFSYAVLITSVEAQAGN